MNKCNEYINEYLHCENFWKMKIKKKFFRNDFYLTIEKGTFERGGKAAARNIEVSISVVDRAGDAIENCIVAAAGIPAKTRLESTVLYHTNSPIWCETFRLEVPIEKFYHSHIRIEFRHCSSES